MNIKLAIRVENLIFLDVFQKVVIFYNFLTALMIKKGPLNNVIISTVSSYFV